MCGQGCGSPALTPQWGHSGSKVTFSGYRVCDAPSGYLGTFCQLSFSLAAREWKHLQFLQQC